jgi:hypothetical protein
MDDGRPRWRNRSGRRLPRSPTCRQARSRCGPRQTRPRQRHSPARWNRRRLRQPRPSPGRRRRCKLHTSKPSTNNAAALHSTVVTVKSADAQCVLSKRPPSVLRVSGAHACTGAHENHETPRADGCGTCIRAYPYTYDYVFNLCVLSFAFQETCLWCTLGCLTLLASLRAAQLLEYVRESTRVRTRVLYPGIQYT